MLKLLDEYWLKAEKAMVVAGFLVMSVVVFADVVYRTAANQAWQTPINLTLLTLAFFALTWAALRTATQGRLSHAKAALLSLLGPVGLYGACGAILMLFPSGLVWAQTLALVLTLWVGFLGASIATKENKHLKVDAAEKLFRGTAKRYVGFVSNVIAALATLALAALAWKFCVSKYQLYVDTQGASGDFEGLPLPQYLAFSVLPLTFVTMTLRFLAVSFQSLRGELPTVEVKS